jgi:hypothetical protein
MGVPPRKASGSRFPLQVLGGFVPQLPVGFPLQSLTRVKCLSWLFMLTLVLGCTSGSEKAELEGSWQIVALEKPQCIPCPEGMRLNNFMGRELYVGGRVRFHADSLAISPHADSTALRFRFKQEGSSMTLEGSDWIYSFQLDSLGPQHMSWIVHQAVTYPVGDSMPDNKLRVLFERRIP